MKRKIPSPTNVLYVCLTSPVIANAPPISFSLKWGEENLAFNYLSNVATVTVSQVTKWHKILIQKARWYKVTESYVGTNTDGEGRNINTKSQTNFLEGKRLGHEPPCLVPQMYFLIWHSDIPTADVCSFRVLVPGQNLGITSPSAEGKQTIPHRAYELKLYYSWWRLSNGYVPQGWHWRICWKPVHSSDPLHTSTHCLRYVRWSF
jgi:hypothetical protein